MNQVILLEFFLLLTLCISGFSQQIDSLENQIDDLYGLDKLNGLISLSSHYIEQENGRKAYKYANQSVDLSEQIISVQNRLIGPESFYLKPAAYINLGLSNKLNRHYDDAEIAFSDALIYARELKDSIWIKKANAELRELHKLSDKGKKKIRFFENLSSSISQKTEDITIRSKRNNAERAVAEKNYNRAIELYKELIPMYLNLGDWREVQNIKLRLAELNQLTGNFTESMNIYQELSQKDSSSEISDTLLTQISNLSNEIEKISKQRKSMLSDLQLPYNIGEMNTNELQKALDDVKKGAEQAEQSNDYKSSLNYYKQFTALQQQLAEEQKQKEITLLAKTHEIQEQHKQIEILRQNEKINLLELEQQNARIDKQNTFRKNLLIGLILSLALILSIILLYFNKRRDLSKLSKAYNKLAIAQKKLKEAESRISNLLHQQVSGPIASELLHSTDDDKIEKRFVCIMFLDIRNFSPFVEKLNPEEIISYQNKVFGPLIEIVEKEGGVINQLLGDGFMATFGAPKSSGNDCENAFIAAKEILKNVKSRSDDGTIPKTRIGIGLHSGYVVTGNVGTELRKQYSITGNTVIIAARLEQLNKQYGSQMVFSKDVYDHLSKKYQNNIEFESVHIKGRKDAIQIAKV